ncbi:MAG: class I SAM-dependent methyltransferase, partial [Burkholderiaceae bacterium]|nr:class I SAM-dependent methyltransferase [Burkholderiaceae bacterium]
EVMAPIYEAIWGDVSRQRYLPVVLDWIKGRNAATTRVLDLACGSGQFADALRTLGCRVYGGDASAALIARAQRRAPNVEFSVCSMDQLPYSANAFDVVLCIFDSINHIERNALGIVFSEVFRVLGAGGQFIFDVNTAEGFSARWCGQTSVIRNDLVCVAQSSFDSIEGIGRMKLTAFDQLDGQRWNRRDATITEWVHAPSALSDCLRTTGFSQVRSHQSTDLGNVRDVGRMFYRATKSL